MTIRLYKLNLLKIPVTDINASAAFYKELLGFKVEFVAPKYGWAQMRTGDLSLALYVPGMGGGTRALGGNVDFHLALDETAFDEIAENLLTAGALVDNQVHTGNDGSTFIDIRDPDGNVLKVFRGC